MPLWVVRRRTHRRYSRVAGKLGRVRGHHQPQPATVPRTLLYRFYWTGPVHGLVRVPLLSRSFLERSTTILEPKINLMLERADRVGLHVKLPVDWQAFAFLPSLCRAHLSIQINGNLFPGIEAISALVQDRSRVPVALVVYG